MVHGIAAHLKYNGMCKSVNEYKIVSVHCPPKRLQCLILRYEKLNRQNNKINIGFCTQNTEFSKNI